MGKGSLKMVRKDQTTSVDDPVLIGGLETDIVIP
jgi:hypothetical protein